MFAYREMSAVAGIFLHARYRNAAVQSYPNCAERKPSLLGAVARHLRVRVSVAALHGRCCTPGFLIQTVWTMVVPYSALLHVNPLNSASQ
jgi:hypothetical protein